MVSSTLEADSPAPSPPHPTVRARPTPRGRAPAFPAPCSKQGPCLWRLSSRWEHPSCSPRPRTHCAHPGTACGWCLPHNSSRLPEEDLCLVHPQHPVMPGSSTASCRAPAPPASQGAARLSQRCGWVPCQHLVSPTTQATYYIKRNALLLETGLQGSPVWGSLPSCCSCSPDGSRVK